MREFIDPDYGYSLDEIPWSAPAAVTEEQRVAARGWLVQNRERFRPATASEITRELTRLSALVLLPSGVGAETMALRFSAYVEELLRLPAASVVAALRQWPRQSRYFPALQEIIESVERIDPDVALRRRVEAVANCPHTVPPANRQPPAPMPPPEHKPMTDADAEALRASLALGPARTKAEIGRGGARIDPATTRRVTEETRTFRLVEMAPEEVDAYFATAGAKRSAAE